jgi:predicted MFS family arabinose efflux permease
VTFGVVALLLGLPNVLIRYLAPAAPQPATAGLRATLHAHLRGFPALARHPNVLDCLAVEILVTGTFAAFATFIAVLAVADLHLTVASASLLACLEGGAFIATVFRAGARVARTPHRVVVGAGTAMSAVSLTGLTFAASLPLLAAFSVTLGVGLGLLNLVATGRAATLPGEKGRVASLFMTATSLGAALGPAFAGALTAPFGTRAAFLGFVPLYALLGARALGPVRAGHGRSRSTSLAG